MAGEEDKKEEKKVEEYHLAKIPTEMGIVIRTPEGEVLDTNSALVLLLNKVDRLEKELIGSK